MCTNHKQQQNVLIKTFSGLITCHHESSSFHESLILPLLLFECENFVKSSIKIINHKQLGLSQLKGFSGPISCHHQSSFLFSALFSKFSTSNTLIEILFSFVFFSRTLLRMFRLKKSFLMCSKKWLFFYNFLEPKKNIFIVCCSDHHVLVILLIFVSSISFMSENILLLPYLTTLFSFFLKKAGLRKKTMFSFLVLIAG